MHYGSLVVKALKGTDTDLFDLLSAKYELFCRARLLHPKRLVEQAIAIIEKVLEEVAVHVPIDGGVTITIWHMKCQTYRPGSAISIEVVFVKTRCWMLSSDTEAILQANDPENYKLQMSAEAKVKGFLRYFGFRLDALDVQPSLDV